VAAERPLQVVGTINAYAAIMAEKTGFSAIYLSGADMIFPEALADLDQFRTIAESVGVPVLANMTEFGVTPLFTLEQLRDAKISIVLYPLSAFRAMSAAAMSVYREIRQKGTQKGILDLMQIRAELYGLIDYMESVQKLDSFPPKEEKV
jgi:methylisocitrate lyase